MQDIAPTLLSHVSNRAKRSRTVQQALADDGWLLDIQGTLSFTAIWEYCQLWDAVRAVHVEGDRADKHVWAWETSGEFTSKSAYKTFFTGSTKFGQYKCLWRSWALLRAKMFLWMALADYRWTSDRLAKRGLDHPERCRLCDQEQETIQHILIQCMVVREVWFLALQQVGLSTLAPSLEHTLHIWWIQAISRVPKELRKGLNSLVILVAWTIWKHRNRCVFDGIPPSARQVLRQVADEEAALWRMSGAQRPGFFVQ